MKCYILNDPTKKQNMPYEFRQAAYDFKNKDWYLHPNVLGMGFIEILCLINDMKTITISGTDTEDETVLCSCNSVIENNMLCAKNEVELLKLLKNLGAPNKAAS